MHDRHAEGKEERIGVEGGGDPVAQIREDCVCDAGVEAEQRQARKWPMETRLNKHFFENDVDEGCAGGVGRAWVDARGKRSFHFTPIPSLGSWFSITTR